MLAGPALAVVAIVTSLFAVDTAGIAPERVPHAGVMVVIGDSWSAGLHADPSRTLAQDAAADLGLSAVVDAVSGTGYVNAPGRTRSYQDRAADLAGAGSVDLVVLQGGSNDDGTDPAVLARAVDATVRTVRAELPGTPVVLLGPGPDPWPVTAKQTAVDTVLRQEAAHLGARYISPFQERWFTAENVDDIIDPSTHHPTVAGDAVLGRLLAGDLRSTVDTSR